MIPNISFENYHRLDLIQKFINRFHAASVNYLEIGCDRNQIFDNIQCARKIGVDPNRGGSHRMTSDDYFNSHNDTFDVIFIDGLHHYDQVTRDVNNALNVLTPQGVIIIHDMLPTHKDEISMPYPIKSLETRYWLGDVWRLSFDLMGRSDITFNLIAMDCGCGIIFKKPQIPVSIIHENTWEWYCNNVNKLPIIKYDEI